MDDIKQRVTDTAIVAQEIKDAMARLERGQNNSHATIAVNAGGVGLWAAVTCCIVSLVFSAVMLALFLDHSRKIDRLEDYTAASYRAASTEYQTKDAK